MVVKAKDATPQQVAEMKRRLNQQKADRWNDIHMDDALRMVQRKNRPQQTAERSASPTRESVMLSAGMAVTAGSAALLGGAGLIPAGYAVAVTGVAVASAVTEIIMGVNA